jgi:hypothetical protein
MAKLGCSTLTDNRNLSQGQLKIRLQGGDVKSAFARGMMMAYKNSRRGLHRRRK